MGVRIRTEIFVNGAWVDISLHVLNRATLDLSWGRRDYASRVTHTKVSPHINNRNGLYSTRNPYSDYFGQLTQNTRIRQSVQLPDGTWEFLHYSEIPAWPKRRDLSGNDVWMPLQCAGILRRLGQGKKPLKDALRRHIEASGPLAYWPLTDGQTAIQGTELTGGGGSPVRSVGTAGSFFQGQPDWGQGQLAPWLDPVVELPKDTSGYVTASIAPRNITSWSVDHVVNSRGAANVTTLEMYDTGAQSATEPRVLWTLNEWGTGSFNEVDLRIVERYDSTSSAALLTTISDPGIYDGGVHHLRLTVASASSGGLTWELFIDGASVASGTRVTAFRPLEQALFRWALVESGGILPEAAPFGHLTYWGPDAPAAIDTWRAATGHVRERAGRRIERLCAEQNVPLTVNGDLDQTPAMGPQKTGTFLDLLQSAADVDGGALHESRDTVGLAYRTRTSKYNQGL